MLVRDIPLDRIQIRDRSRTEIRNIPSLAASIRDRGLLQPVVIRRDGERFVLVAGGRRIEALRSLGRATVAAHVAESLNDELDALLAEGEENTEREPFTPSEAVAHAERIEAIEKQRADERRREGARKGGVAPRSVTPMPGAVALDFVEPAEAPVPTAALAEAVVKLASPSNAAPVPQKPRPAPDRSRDRVAKAVGMKPTSLAKARHVVETAKDESAPPPVREAAREAAEAMDRTGKVDPAYRKVRDTRAALADAPLNDLLSQDAAIKRAKLRAAINGAVIQIRNGLPKLSPEHCAEAMNAEDWEDVLRAREILDEWIEQVQSLRKPAGLKLVK